MNAYKHYSFDLWMTLIKSNPLFKPARAQYFYQKLNPRKKTIEEVAGIFRKTDIMCNAINEATGRSIDGIEMYLMVIAELNNYNCAFGEIDLPALYADMEQLVFTHLPEVYDGNTIKVLSKLSTDHSMSILSNTAFIKGSTLRIVLQQIGLAGYFNFQLYSDETGMSKPNKQFYKLMLHNIAKVSNENIAPNQIIHIGDNVKADIEGANAMGIPNMLINVNEKTILNLLD